jgi:dienelactone hydrolase
MKLEERPLESPLQGVLVVPEKPNGLGVIVLGGSSGSINVERARLFAAQGASAIALRWFGGAGQSPGICEIPLEDFMLATDRLIERGCNRFAYVGTSKGAEAALVLAMHDQRIEIVIAFSPSSVAWANTGIGRDGQSWPLRSSWTFGGKPLSFVPFDVSKAPEPQGGLMHFRKYHEDSLSAFTDSIPAASIAVEKSRATFVLVAGGDDALWPSEPSAIALAKRLDAAGKRYVLVTHPGAGHRTLLPGETTPRSAVNAHGGSDEADRELGKQAWAAICEVCGFGAA